MEDEGANEASTQLHISSISQAMEMKDAENTETDNYHNVAVEAGPSHAQRAYIAHAAPHLLNGLQSMSPSPSSSDIDVSSLRASPVPNGRRSGISSSASDGSPSQSLRPSPSPSEEDRDRSKSRDTAQSPIQASDSEKQRSHHSVPKKYRGPQPMIGDAEHISPLPILAPIAGVNDMYNMVNYPLNRNGWRYVAAGPASEYLPQSVYKTLETEPHGVHWSWADRSAFTHLSQDACTASATNGFRCLRANVPVREGSWYVEVQILEPDGPPSNEKDGNHIRLGWGRREALLNAPVGSNGYSYGLRDTTGEKVFLARTYRYGTPFQPGDVIGMWISLPPSRKADPSDPLDPARIERKRIPIRYKGRLYFEQLELAVPKEMDRLMDRSRRGEKLQAPRGAPLNETMINVNSGLLTDPKAKEEGVKRKGGAPPPGSGPVKDPSANLRQLPTLGPESLIGFFVNGEPQGVAFQNLLDFRPLRRQRAGQQNSTLKSKVTTTRGLGAGDEDEEEKAITTSSTAASIMKSRENHFDDGALGYFPIISLYGNARARIVSKRDQMRFPPPENVRQALEEADRRKDRFFIDRTDVKQDDIQCRALEERYEEFLQEMWQYDLADEVKAQAEARKRELEDSSDEDDDDTTMQSSVKHTSKRSRKKGYSGNKRTATTHPSTRAHTPTADSRIASSSPPIRSDIKLEEDENIGGNEIKEELISHIDEMSAKPSPASSDYAAKMEWDSHRTEEGMNSGIQSPDGFENMEVDENA